MNDITMNDIIGMGTEAAKVAALCIEYVTKQYEKTGEDILHLGENASELLMITREIYGTGSLLLDEYSEEYQKSMEQIIETTEKIFNQEDEAE